jgi:hypothetical protein
LDWTLAIARNREALQRIVAALFALAGLANGAAFAVLPRQTYRAILLVLRPAESAVRRLIVIAAHGLSIKANPSRSMPIGLTPSKGQARAPAFTLIDPLKRFAPFSQTDEDKPNAFAFVEDEEEENDHFENASIPRISVPGFFNPTFHAPASDPAPNDLINAARLSRRLDALMRALSDLPKQARRLARWQARRDLALQSSAPRKPRRLSAIRPGSPPGSRHRHHEVDHVLRECHLLMLDRLADTS